MFMNKITNYAKQHSLEIIKDFIESYGDWDDKNTLLKRDLEYVYNTVSGYNKLALVDCDIYISNRYPQIFEVAGKYNLVRVPISVVESYSEEMLCQVLLNTAHFLKDCVTRNNTDHIINTAAETVVKQVAKRAGEALLGVNN